MKKVLVVIAATFASVSFAGNVFALNNKMFAPEKLNNNDTFRSDRIAHLRADRKLRRKKLIGSLNLDSSQQQQMQTIKSKYQPQIRNLRENIRSERKKLANMMKSNDSVSDLRVQHQKIIDLDQKIHNLRFEIMLEMRDILTTEQRQQLVESMEEFRANRRGRFR